MVRLYVVGNRVGTAKCRGSCYFIVLLRPRRRPALHGWRKRPSPDDKSNGTTTSIAIHPPKINRVSRELCQRDILLQQTEEHIKASERPPRCLQCYGNLILPDHRRVQGWSQYKSTLRHFRKKHLDDRTCYMYEMYLGRHARRFIRFTCMKS